MLPIQENVAGVGKSIQDHLPEDIPLSWWRGDVSIKIFVYVCASAVQKNIL